MSRARQARQIWLNNLLNGDAKRLKAYLEKYAVDQRDWYLSLELYYLRSVTTKHLIVPLHDRINADINEPRRRELLGELFAVPNSEKQNYWSLEELDDLQSSFEEKWFKDEMHSDMDNVCRFLSVPAIGSPSTASYT
jgi:hypothetical protein